MTNKSYLIFSNNTKFNENRVDKIKGNNEIIFLKIGFSILNT